MWQEFAARLPAVFTRIETTVPWTQLKSGKVKPETRWKLIVQATRAKMRNGLIKKCLYQQQYLLDGHFFTYGK